MSHFTVPSFESIQYLAKQSEAYSDLMMKYKGHLLAGTFGAMATIGVVAAAGFPVIGLGVLGCAVLAAVTALATLACVAVYNWMTNSGVKVAPEAPKAQTANPVQKASSASDAPNKNSPAGAPNGLAPSNK